MSDIYKVDFSGWYFKLLFVFRNKCRVVFFNWLIQFICYLKRVKLGKNVIFNGSPVIRRYPNSRIIIGNTCEFNSARNSVMVGLLRPCTFITLTKNAEITIGNSTGASGVTIVSATKVKIGDNVLIGADCTIVDNDFHHADPNKRIHEGYPSRPVVIEDNVFLGFNCLILKGVTIGRNSVIGANSLVIKSIPPNSIALGNPCKVIIKRNWENFFS
ncbi:MAG: acyltransferase [Bacteroidales bacterium]|nr:acyltransferase [Bacteroidales bacterium]